MKKLMFTLSLALFVFAGNIYAQAPAAGTSTDESTVKTKTPGTRATTLTKGTKSKAAANGKVSSANKAKVLKHKDEIKANADTKEEAKDYVKEQHQNGGEATQKDKVKSHRAEIKAKADSKEEAKSKLQRKHEKNKTE
ncbi:MAG: hypothetical protein KBF42_01185 [Chitinophagales bacterium]|jgi:hypothetical protein|nr:hypothetical protein [Bacteroidota bacterium]MBK7569840.1 hypothetical protein [Bacteroidota bacterium]MBP8915578.1 hypothetical protein [Chitinophagales bacterium]MBP9219970.1 hypothetical protein [Chitinophagales bacterium]MBP9794553.1 hypothetical protein [Chitinophagales bacterium]